MSLAVVVVVAVVVRFGGERVAADFDGHALQWAERADDGAWLQDVDIDGEIRNVRINGVDVAPLIEAELNRRYPERTKLDPADADGFREAWAIIERVWPPTVERAKRLPPELLHERVEGEWSFIETLRHLGAATDAWVRRAILGLPEPYSPLGLPTTRRGPTRACRTTR